MKINHTFSSQYFHQKFNNLSNEHKSTFRASYQAFTKNCFSDDLKTTNLNNFLFGVWSFKATSKHFVTFEFFNQDSVGFIDIDEFYLYQNLIF